MISKNSHLQRDCDHRTQTAQTARVFIRGGGLVPGS